MIVESMLTCFNAIANIKSIQYTYFTSIITPGISWQFNLSNMSMDLKQNWLERRFEVGGRNRRMKKTFIRSMERRRCATDFFVSDFNVEQS